MNAVIPAAMARRLLARPCALSEMSTGLLAGSGPQIRALLEPLRF